MMTDMMVDQFNYLERIGKTRDTLKN